MLKLLRKGESARKVELQQRLKLWIESNSGQRSGRQNQTTVISVAIHDTPTCQVKQPSALVFNDAQILFVADEHSNTIFMMNIETNGITVSATILSQIKCPKQTFGIAVLDNYIYISSSDPVSGGIFCYEYDGDLSVQYLIQSDTKKWISRMYQSTRFGIFCLLRQIPRTLFSVILMLSKLSV